MKVLLVDDKKEQIDALSRILEKLGHQYATAKSADEALKYLIQQYFDVVVADYSMPGNLDGVDLLRAVRLQWPDTKRILISGSIEFNTSFKKRADEGLFNHLLQKPILQSSLEEVFSTFSEKQSSKDDGFLMELLRFAPDPIVISNDRGDIIWFNQQFTNIFDWEYEDLLGKKVEILLPKKLRLSHIDKRNSYFENPKTMSMASNRSGVALSKSGEEIYVELNLSYVDRGGYKMAIISIRDIRQRLKLEDELIKSRERLLQAQSMAHLGHWECDLSTEELFWSKETYDIFEVPESTFQPSLSAFFNFIHPDDLNKVKEAYTKHLEENVEYEIHHRILLHNGKIKYLFEKCITERNDAGTPIRSIGTVQDVTRQQEDARKIIENEKRLNLLIHNAPIGIATLNTKGEIIEANPHFCKLFELTKNEIRGLTYKELTHESDLQLSKKARVMHETEGTDVSLKKRCVNKSGKVFWASVKLVKFSKPKEESYSLLMLQDINAEIEEKERTESNAKMLEEKVTERTMQLEMAKEQAEQANKAKSFFLANMSHEIRTPLNAIMGFGKLIKESKEPLPPQSIEYFRYIDSASSLLKEVIGNILDLSKIEEGKISMDKSSLDILALFKGIYHVNKVKAQDKKIKFSYHIESNVSQWVLSDRQLLNQIIINLVSNAIKFTDAEKSVTMSLGQKGSDILISVADEGIGMNEEQASRVFSPFEQADNSIRREFGGTGLGLSIVKKICDLMKGSIEVDSQLGKGSEFRVQIPIVKTGAKEINESHHQFKNNINVMVVDDNPINQKLMKSVLRVVGLKYCGYSSGREALDNLSSDKPDLILLDLHMPDMDGLDVLNAMKKLPELEKPLVFMVSADVFQETVKACKKAGALEFLSKPIDLKELKGFLSKYFPDTHQEGLIQVEDSNHANELNILFQRLHTIPYIEKEIIGDVLEEMRHLVDPNSSKYQDFLELEKISLTKDESEFKKSLLKFSDKMT